MKEFIHPFLKVSMVIPVYGGEGIVVREVQKAEKLLMSYCADYEIIIGDDRSPDNTRAFLQSAFKDNNRIKIITNKKNMGIARNIFNLYTLAKKDFILFFVADGDWDVRSVSQLIKHELSTHADIVIGRREKKEGYTPYRTFISFLHNVLPIIFFGVNTIDAGSLKLYKRSLVQNQKILSRSVFLDAEIIIRSKRKGATIASVPIKYKKPFTQSGVAAKPTLVFSSFLDLLRLRLSIL